jgi:hypothetical protein
MAAVALALARDRFRFLRSLGVDDSDNEELEMECGEDGDDSVVTEPYSGPIELCGDEWDSDMEDWDTDTEEWHEENQVVLPDNEKEDKELIEFLENL